MSRVLEEFLEDPSSAEKELTRKLYWAITSTLSLTRPQKTSTFSWVADLAEKIVKRASAAPPPAARSETPGRPTLARGGKKRYAALAGGGAAGSFRKSGGEPLPSKDTASRQPHPHGSNPARHAAFLARQASLKVRAVDYMERENVRLGITANHRKG